MENRINISCNDLYIPLRLINDDIGYIYQDEIGVFSKKYPLIMEKKNGFLIINLEKSFSSNLTEEKSIEIPLKEKVDFDEEINSINSFYNLELKIKNNKLIINIVNKHYGLLSINEMTNYSNAKMTTILRKMINGNSTYFTDKIYLKKLNDINEIIEIIYNKSMKIQEWKLLIEYKDLNNNMCTRELNISEFYSKYQTKFKESGILVHNVKNILKYEKIENKNVNTITFGSEFVELSFDKDIKDNYLYIAKRERGANPFNYKSYIKTKINIANQSIKVYYNSLKFDWLKNGDNLDILIGTSLKDAKFIGVNNKFELDNEYFTITNKFDGKIYKNGRNALSVYIKQKTKMNNINSTKVAILGTCFSRNAFNTSEYFNPEYKDLIQCVYTQFHSTIESLITDVKAPTQLFEEYSDNTDFKYINTDFNKLFFKELHESSAEYIIIDLYPDATLNQLTLKNESIITYNYMIKENQNLGYYVKDWGDSKFEDEDKYITKWTESLNKFINKLTEIIPENKIILNRGRLSKYYYEDETVKEFRTIDLINRSNYYWELLDNTFIQKYPNIKIIDITDKPFYADKNYPFGFSYSHYESDYYKSFFNELIKILYKDKL